MKRAMCTMVFADLVFLMLLTVSGAFKGVISDVIYLLAFAVPTFASLFVSRGDLAESRICISKKDFAFILHFIPITILLVIGLSFVTSLALGALGIENQLSLKGDFFEAVLRYAVFSSILEEMLFRYIPMRLMAHYSPRATVLFSSIFFSLVHADLFQIPYAFIAGIVFIVIDMATCSPLPSVVIHFLNNLLVVIFYFNEEAATVSIIVLSLLSLIGAVALVLKRKEYVARVKAVCEKGVLQKGDTFFAWFFIVPVTIIAFIEILT